MKEVKEMYLAKSNKVVSDQYLDELKEKYQEGNIIYAIMEDGVLYEKEQRHDTTNEMKKVIAQYQWQGYKVFYHMEKEVVKKEEVDNGKETKKPKQTKARST